MAHLAPANIDLCLRPHQPLRPRQPQLGSTPVLSVARVYSRANLDPGARPCQPLHPHQPRPNHTNWETAATMCLHIARAYSAPAPASTQAHHMGENCRIALTIRLGVQCDRSSHYRNGDRVVDIFKWLETYSGPTQLPAQLQHVVHQSIVHVCAHGDTQTHQNS